MTNASELKGKGIKATGWNFLGMLIQQLRGFIVSLILARLLEPSDFGLISMALVFSGILDAIVDMGFSSAIIQKEKITATQKSTVFYLNVIVGFIFSLSIFILSPVMASFFSMDELSAVMKVLCWSFFISSFGTVQIALLQKELNFKIPFQAKVVSSISSGILGIILAFLGFGVWSLVVMNIIGWSLNTIIIWLRSKWRPILAFNFSEIYDLWSFGWKMSCSTVISQTFKKIDTIIIGKLFSAATLGLYNRAQSLNNLVIQYSFTSIQGAMLPTLSKLQNDLAAMRETVMKLIHLICFLNFLFSGLMYVCAEELITILYGDKWVDAADFFRILGIFAFSTALAPLLDTIMSSMNRMTLYLNVEIAKKILLAIAIPIGVFGGVYHYVWACQMAMAIGTILTFYTATISIKLSFWKQIFALFRYVLVFAIAIIICLNISFIDNIEYDIIRLVVKSIIFFVSYIAINILLKSKGVILAKNQLLYVLKRVKK